MVYTSRLCVLRNKLGWRDRVGEGGDRSGQVRPLDRGLWKGPVAGAQWSREGYRRQIREVTKDKEVSLINTLKLGMLKGIPPTQY
jgi:hypothetical protein